jgi:hypothetical protein
MADIALSAAVNVKPLVQSIIKPVIAGEIVDVGEIVYLKSDGKYWLADADALITSQARGIVVGIGAYGAVTSVADQQIDVCFYGPVNGWTALTPGANLYASVTAGAIANAVPSTGDFIWVIGYAYSAEAIFVSPWTYDITAQ